MLRDEVKILVVDDVNTMRMQISQLLKTFGFSKIETAESVEQAQQLLAADTFQLILCDWHMTGASGLDLLKLVRGQPNLKDIGFIMVTAENTKERVIDAVKSGVDDYLMKPLTILQIQDKVFGVLLRKKIL